MDGAVLVRDGLIDEIGPARRVENLAAARHAREISAAGRVVMPGFVDSHTHLLFPPRGERAADPEGAARVWAESSARMLAFRSRRFIEAMVRHGTTTVEIKTGVGLDESSAVKALRVMALLRENPIEILPTYLLRLPDEAGEAELLEMVSRAAPRVLRRGMAAFADICWGGAGRRAFHLRYLAEAAATGAGLKIHARGPSCADAVVAAVGHRAVSVDHLEHLTAEVAPVLGRGGTIATLMPTASLDPWAPAPPARALIDAGAAVALATDFNPQHSPILSMQAAVAMACVNLGMTPAEAISAATINGAWALRQAARVGSLEPGKIADVLLLDADDYREIARSVGVNLVHLVVKSGVLVYRAGSVVRTAAG